MSFSWDIKKKLCRIELACPFCTRSELAGIVGFSGDFSENRLKLLTEHKMLAERIAHDLSECIGYDAVIENGKTNRILIEETNILDNLRSYLYIDDIRNENEFENEILGLECCRASYIRGAFLSGGCVLNPENSYHLEFDTKYKKSAGRLERLLKSMGYPAKLTFRKGHHLVYVKGYEGIAEILGIIGAGGGALTMYSVQIEKEFRNSVNRQVNCDTANAKKLAEASSKQISAIKKIKKNMGLSALPDSLKELAELRLAYPEESLKSLGEMLAVPIGKSGVNHRMNKIIEFSEKL